MSKIAGTASSSAFNGIRFAPSPTGRFHAGNLRTAWISAAFARAWNQPLIIRIEDIDAPRILAGAAAQQLRDMSDLGIKPHASYYQSENIERHFRLFMEAVDSSQIYPCDCSRKDVQSEVSGIASAPHAPPALYSGNCRTRNPNDVIKRAKGDSLAWRFKLPDVSGRGDFVIARTPVKDPALMITGNFIPSYHWACAIDDHDGSYALLVRAWDLDTSAPLQRAIQSWICKFEGVTPTWPAVFHTSLIVQENGHRLEKRTLGVTLPELALSGILANELSSIFANSFAAEHLLIQPRSGALLGEKNREMKLSELGLKPA